MFCDFKGTSAQERLATNPKPRMYMRGSADVQRCWNEGVLNTEDLPLLQRLPSGRIEGACLAGRMGNAGKEPRHGESRRGSFPATKSFPSRSVLLVLAGGSWKGMGGVGYIRRP